MTPFIINVAGGTALLGVSLIFGILRWQRPYGKIVTAVAILLLIVLAAWVAFVLILAESASRGAPF
jgi:hypothetical protein